MSNTEHDPRTTSNEQEAWETAARLEGKLHAIAKKLGRSSDTLDASDLHNIMVEAIVSRAAEKSNFLAQADAYIVSYASWKARNRLASERTYHSHIMADADVLLPDDMGDQADSTGIELIASTEMSPETQAEQSEMLEALMDVVATLSSRHQQVIRMIYLGYQQKEIAAELNVSAPAISQIIKSVGAKVQMVMAL